nr:hypothetical protein [Streptomyces sp. DSM 41633]
MFARSTTIAARTQAINAGIAHVRDEVMPALDTIHGSVGLSLMVDRQTGDGVLTTAWRSEEAMHATATVDEWEIAAVHREQY